MSLYDWAIVCVTLGGALVTIYRSALRRYLATWRWRTSNLDRLYEQCPDHSSGNVVDLYFQRELAPILRADRDGTVQELRRWIRLRSLPKTAIALDMVQSFALLELRPEVEALLRETLNGRAFRKWYGRYAPNAAQHVEEVLQSISSGTSVGASAGRYAPPP